MFDIDQKISTEKAKIMNPVVLAYIGDGVHSLYEREKLAFSSDKKSGTLNKLEAQKVCASAQAAAVDSIMQLFTEEELSIYKRARNSKKGSKAKNSTAGQYVKSTGFEAVMGFLYVVGNKERLNFLLNRADEAVNDKIAADLIKKAVKKEKPIVCEKDKSIVCEKEKHAADMLTAQNTESAAEQKTEQSPAQDLQTQKRINGQISKEINVQPLEMNAQTDIGATSKTVNRAETENN